MQNEILAAAWAGVRGEYTLPAAVNECLMLVRTVVEHALGLPPDGFYTQFLVGHAKAQPKHTGWWARDAEHILRPEYAVHVAQPGDLLFDSELAPPYGHVALLLEHDMVLENCARKYRPFSFYPRRGAVALTPLRRWPQPTTVVRLR